LFGGRGALAVAVVCALAGCGRQERVIEVTSEPPGAIVWVNDLEIGRTPCDTDFKFFGTYDVRLALDGYEPLMTSAVAEAPLYELPGIDLVAAALPGKRATKVRWHFVLSPVPESGDKAGAERALIERAVELRGRVGGTPPAAEPGTPTAVPGEGAPPSSP
jgi:hypothetical protein